MSLSAPAVLIYDVHAWAAVITTHDRAVALRPATLAGHKGD
jgi:hypothetical protein